MSTLAHDTLIEMTAARLVDLSYSRVRASHIARFNACEQIGSYIPDVTAFHGSTLVVMEAESHEGLTQAHTEAQWKTFHAHASRVGGFFVAVVNKADEHAARTLLTQVCGTASNAHLWVF